ncbi:ABC transporter substrate-binding protein [Telluria mixta]|uniref:ABC transporter substrate-binding protein n=1 Tax=Telluria mixta TaxID=34071 RepID=A0ABT2C1C9_9BURK|nr:ABC transporter substrate-binding protein [Telluria mixta]MCS0631182.1 ABC transporter substrate-binding protein [Telluria mixta]WEM95722.1 ABC transporter substrate-binding protein [Telluria mixta]
MTHTIDRRGFLRGAARLGLGLAAGGLAAPYVARAAAARLRIVSNPGLENATLNALMAQQGLFERYGVDAVIVEAVGIAGPFDAIAAGHADVCMVSGYNRVLSRIGQGAPVKIVGAGMKKCALTVYARPGGIRTLADLPGRTVAVGPHLGLLHESMLQLLKEKGIDERQVKFVDKGSNDQCYHAVVDGEADACCASISHLNDRDGLVTVAGGNLWEALPRYTFQTAYASDTALKDKHESLVAAMAAYGALYEFLMSPASHDAFFEARRRAQKAFDAPSAQAIWDFNRVQKPYSKNLALDEDDIAYLQRMFIGLGSLKTRQPFAAVADMAVARAAAALP